MVGASSSIADCNVVLNTAVAESLRQFADILERADDFHTALNHLIRHTIKKHKRIIFNGNGYDDKWIREAVEERGLLNLRTTPEAMPHYLNPKNIRLFTSHHVYTEAEIYSRYEIMLENYVKTVGIEAMTMVDMVHKQILPAITTYTKELSEAGVSKKQLSSSISTVYEEKIVEKLSNITCRIYDEVNSLEEAVEETKKIMNITDRAFAVKDDVITKMASLRKVCDEAEFLTAEKYWPFPTYAQLLFGVQ